MGKKSNGKAETLKEHGQQKASVKQDLHNGLNSDSKEEGSKDSQEFQTLLAGMAIDLQTVEEGVKGAGGTPCLRRRLIADMLSGRAVLRCLSASAGMGKTTVAWQYANTLYPEEAVLWIDGRVEAFIAAVVLGLDAVIFNGSKAKVSLVVIDDLPFLDEEQAQMLSRAIDAMLAANTEVVICCTPANDVLAAMQPQRIVVSSRELMLQGPELQQVNQCGGHLTARQLVKSKGIPVLVAKGLRKGFRYCLDGLIEDHLESKQMSTVLSMLILQQGSFSDLGPYGAPSLKDDLEWLAGAYPFLGISSSNKRFESFAIPTRRLATYLRAQGGARQFGIDAYQVSRLARNALKTGHGDRALDIVESFVAPRQKRAFYQRYFTDLIDVAAPRFKKALDECAGDEHMNGARALCSLSCGDGWHAREHCMAGLIVNEQGTIFTPENGATEGGPGRLEDALRSALACALLAAHQGVASRRKGVNAADIPPVDARLLSAAHRACRGQESDLALFAELTQWLLAIGGGKPIAFDAVMKLTGDLEGQPGFCLDVARRNLAIYLLGVLIAWVELENDVQRWPLEPLLALRRRVCSLASVEVARSGRRRSSLTVRLLERLLSAGAERLMPECTKDAEWARLRGLVADVVAHGVDCGGTGSGSRCAQGLLGDRAANVEGGSDLDRHRTQGLPEGPEQVDADHACGSDGRSEQGDQRRLERASKSTGSVSNTPSVDGGVQHAGAQDAPLTKEGASGQGTGSLHVEEHIPLLYVRLFGSFRVYVDGRERSIATLAKRRGRELLAMLLLRDGAELPRDEVAQALWNKMSMRQGLDSLYSSWSHLRRAVGQLTGTDGRPYLENYSFHYRINPRYLSSDIHDFNLLARLLLKEGCESAQEGSLDFGLEGGSAWCQSIADRQPGILRAGAGGFLPPEVGAWEWPEHPAEWIDADADYAADDQRFEKLTSTPRTDRRIQLFDLADEICRGELLAGCELDARSEEIADRLRERVTEVMLAGVRYASSLGMRQRASWFAGRAIEVGGMREEFYRARMEAQFSLGQRTGALETYFKMQRFLSEQQGLDPSGESAQLYQRLLGDDQESSWGLLSGVESDCESEEPDDVWGRDEGARHKRNGSDHDGGRE